VGSDDPNNTIRPVTTDRGFTNHEHLDTLGLIHMNARVYDPAIGRFMSPDPIVQDPYDLQSYNRYSYVRNNPLLYLDPSGHSWWTHFRDHVLKPVVAIAVVVFAPEISGYLGWTGGYISSAAGTTAMTGGLSGSLGLSGAVASGMLGGAMAGGIIGGDLRSAAIGGITGGAFGYVGDVAPSGLGNVVGHAAVGCASASMSGGDCGSGALSGAFGSIASQNMPAAFKGNFALQLTYVTVVGGTASALGGGKFANGAKTAAFGYLFNQCAHGGCWGKDAAYSAPLAPPGVDVDNNIKDAGAASFGLKGSSWFYDEVRNKGPWDYKQLGSQYQDFGNFNYGATGAAFGYSEDTLLRMAGWAQVQSGTSQPGWGVTPNKFQAYLGIGGRAPYGDDPSDQSMIKRGIEYYRALRGN
jgi:RHS repeat-associated protein